MKKTTLYRNRDRELEIRMTPMIDVVFLLLVFFVWTASFRMVENYLPTNLVSQSGTVAVDEISPEIDFDKIVIRIVDRDDPKIMLNGNEVAGINELQQRLSAIARIKRDIDVMIDAAGEVAMGTLIDVFDVAQLVGFDRINFATPVQPE